jgi:hypothetical protein
MHIRCRSAHGVHAGGINAVVRVRESALFVMITAFSPIREDRAYIS